jgi:hypothetical protein
MFRPVRQKPVGQHGDMAYGSTNPQTGQSVYRAHSFKFQWAPFRCSGLETSNENTRLQLLPFRALGFSLGKSTCIYTHLLYRY